MVQNYEFLATYSVIAKSSVNQDTADILRNAIRQHLKLSESYTFYDDIETTFSGEFELSGSSKLERKKSLEKELLGIFAFFKSKHDVRNQTRISFVAMADGVGIVDDNNKLA